MLNPHLRSLESHGCVAAPPSDVQAATGSALIGLVVAILVFSVLSAAIVPMVSSSGQQVPAANSAANAYLMAESGFRYGASRYLHAGATDPQKNTVLEDLDGNYTLADSKHGFELKVFSYFYEILNVSPGVGSPTTIKAHSPGTFPADDISAMPAGLKIRIGDDTYTLADDSQAVADQDDNVTFEVATSTKTFGRRTIIYPVAVATTTSPVETVAVDGGNNYNIQCQNDHTSMFPMRNGRVRIDGQYYTYRYNDRANDKLMDIRDPADPYNLLLSFDVPPGGEILLTPFVRLASTGIHGQGDTATRRTVTYHVPLTLPETATVQQTFTDTFEDDDDWQDTGGTDTATENPLGSDNSALRVTTTPDPVDIGGEDVQGALTAFNPTTPEAKVIDFRGSRRGTQGFLNYETQLKIGYDTTLTPPVGSYFPAEPIPALVAAGLSFRLKDLPTNAADANLFNVNTYGISFMRGTDLPDDGIPDDLVPIPDERIMVLWQQTQPGTGAERTWLAYKKMADTFFEEDFETDNRFTRIIPSGWNFATGGRQRGDSTNNWLIPGNQSGLIRSTIISLPDDTDAALSFWSWHSTETNQLKQVLIRDALTLTSQVIHVIADGDGEPDWNLERLEIPEFYQGRAIQVEFELAPPVDPANTFEGWYIDDVKVFYPWPVQEATVVVRLQEALVVPFKEGTARIRQGDRIFGSTFFTAGTVMAPPLLTDGNWTTEDAAEGTILLNRVATIESGAAFELNEDLLELGGTGRAKVSDYSHATDNRANIIRVYYAAAEGSGVKTGNADPLDRDTEPYPRLGENPGLIELQWPPDLDEDGNWTDDDGNWTDGEDYFRLVQWDALNSAVGSRLSAHGFMAKKEGLKVLVDDAVIQSQDPRLESPLVFGPGTANPELGLHALGAGATNVFFDDFGIRIDVSVEDTVPAPVQQ